MTPRFVFYGYIEYIVIDLQRILCNHCIQLIELVTDHSTGKGEATLNTEIPKLEGLSTEWLQRYVETRDKIDKEANSIYAVTSLIALLESCGDDTLNLDPVALGKIHKILNTNILNIWEILDDFIYIVQAQMLIEGMEK